ncbi:MAG: BREX system ATP-binding domain-containing protein, partial [Nitrospirales bacterium]
MSMSSREWVSIIHREYLQRYVRDGGSAVKFAVGVEGVDLSPLSTQLQSIAQQEGFLVVHTDAQTTKVHLIDLFFHEIARQIDWDELAYQFLKRVLAEHQCQVPEASSDCHWTSLAVCNGRDEEDLQRDVTSWLEQTIYCDCQMSLEFRLAMIQLCLARLSSPGTTSKLAVSIKAWLRGELRLISALKEALIFQKITRNNARHMITSLTHWIRLIGNGGLVVSMNIAAFMKSHSSKNGTSGISYSSSAVLDAYEMLRQFIDGTDEIEGLFLVVIAPCEFLTNQRLGLNRYEALKLRIWDDVRDKHRQNPLAPMLRLSDEGSSSGTTVSHGWLSGSGNISDQRVIEALRAG